MPTAALARAASSTQCRAYLSTIIPGGDEGLRIALAEARGTTQSDGGQERGGPPLREVNITKDTALTEKGRDGQRSRGQREYARQNLVQAGTRRPTGPSHIQAKDQTSF